MKVAAALTRSLATLVIAIGFAAHTAGAADLSRPVTLVATSSLESSGFAETVLFASPLPNGMHVGMIINRPSTFSLATLFPEHAASRKVAAPVYVGGPVLPDMVFAVVRTPVEQSKATLQLMPGLTLVVDETLIDHIIETTPNDARYFAGLVVWRPGELDQEIEAGAWQVNPADAASVFSAHPEQLWKTLSRGGLRLEAAIPAAVRRG